MKKLVLACEMEFLHAEKIRCENKLQQVKQEIRESLEQSSETWHDNSPFEAALDSERNAARELSEILDTIDNVHIDDGQVLGIVIQMNGNQYFVTGLLLSIDFYRKHYDLAADIKILPHNSPLWQKYILEKQQII